MVLDSVADDSGIKGAASLASFSDGYYASAGYYDDGAGCGARVWLV